MRTTRSAAQGRPWGPIVLLVISMAAACASTAVGQLGAPADGQLDGVDPFYERLFQDGTLALSTGDVVGAQRQLRLACFGMLDATERLADCLTRLALAHAGAEDREAFLGTLSRLVEVERRFRSYSKASIPPEMRRDLEQRVEAWAPSSLLTGLPAFEDAADRQQARSLRELAPDDRRRELDRLIAQSPRKAIWRQLQIELELESGDYRLAAELIDRQPPGRDDMRCLRGRAQAGLGSCDARTVADLESCDGEQRPVALEALLTCHVANGDKRAGEALAADLDAAQRQRRAIRDLLRQLDRLPAMAPSETVTEPAPDEPERLSAEEPSGPTADEIATLDRGWTVLEQDQRQSFDETFTEVAALALEYSAWDGAQHLAAELAYRLSRWPEAVSFFERAEAVSTLRPNQQFYLAVALFKSGQQEAAERRLDECLPQIRETDYVRFWTQRIRAGGS